MLANPLDLEKLPGRLDTEGFMKHAVKQRRALPYIYIYI